jgi:predicted acylesterase/phospholipase RssA
MPHLFTVCTKVSRTGAAPTPFLCRNYQNPRAHHKGESDWPLWQAMCASASAPVYAPDFERGGDIFTDGALVANNPTYIAIEEARTLWPGRPIGVVCSVGTGRSEFPPWKTVRGSSSILSKAMTVLTIATDPEKEHQLVKQCMAAFGVETYARLVSPAAVALDEWRLARLHMMNVKTAMYVHGHLSQTDMLVAAIKRLMAADVKPEDISYWYCEDVPSLRYSRHSQASSEGQA